MKKVMDMRRLLRVSRDRRWMVERSEVVGGWEEGREEGVWVVVEMGRKERGVGLERARRRVGRLRVERRVMRVVGRGREESSDSTMREMSAGCSRP